MVVKCELEHPVEQISSTLPGTLTPDSNIHIIACLK